MVESPEGACPNRNRMMSFLTSGIIGLAALLAVLNGCGGAGRQGHGVPPAGELYHGQKALIEKVEAGGPLEGALTIIDTACRVADSHCAAVTETAAAFGTPRENIIHTEKGRFGEAGYESVLAHPDALEEPIASGDAGAVVEELNHLGTALKIFLTRETWEAHRQRTKVVVMPFGPVFNQPGDGSLLASRNILFVASIGNVIADESRPFDEGGFVRNWYTPGWCSDRESVERRTGGGNVYCDLLNDGQLARIFNNLKEAQGKALYATWGDIKDGEVVPYPYAVSCGEAKNDCFTVILPPEHRGREIGSFEEMERYAVGTSFASPALGSYLFYLSQLWDDAKQVRSVLNECAIDVGAPGIDGEFGRGVPSADCPQVARKERAAARASVSLDMRSPLMNAQGALMPGSGARSRNGSTPSRRESGTNAKGLPAFHDTGPRGKARAPLRFSFAASARQEIVPNIYLSEDMLGAGLTRHFTTGESISFSFGQGYDTLAVSSSLAGSRRWNSFMEVGVRKPVLARRGALVELSGSYGQASDEMRTRVFRAGLRSVYREGNHSVAFGLEYAWAAGAIGIPGYRDVGRNKAPFTKESFATAVSYRLEF